MVGHLEGGKSLEKFGKIRKYSFEKEAQALPLNCSTHFHMETFNLFLFVFLGTVRVLVYIFCFFEQLFSYFVLTF